MNGARTSLILAGFLLAFVPAFARAAQEPAARRPPNVILILADDFGYECVGANGGMSYRTPVLDRLAATGVRFEQCYAQPLCTPTRVQLMTGLSNVRNYVDFGSIDPKATTFAHLLKRAGYATAVAGKWQLGRDPQLPKTLGFDEACLWQHTRRPPRYANPGLEYNGVEKDFTSGEYGPDLVNDYALDFIARHKERPFFLYYPMMLTHDPYQPTPDSPDWDPAARGEQVNRAPKHFGEMVAYMDKLIGKVVTSLEANGIRDDTLILFLGDNGTGKGTRSMMGDRVVIGGKGSTTDAGMRVPLIASWPGGGVKGGRVCADLVDSTDFLPTLCEAAGAAVPADLKLDGRTFLPQLRGEAGRPREWCYAWYCRDGSGAKAKEFAFDRRYKLFRTGELYDRQNDPEEKAPLTGAALEEPSAAAAAKELAEALRQYDDARPAGLRGAGRKAAPTDE